jgi:hypothetical protein
MENSETSAKERADDDDDDDDTEDGRGTIIQ